MEVEIDYLHGSTCRKYHHHRRPTLLPNKLFGLCDPVGVTLIANQCSLIVYWGSVCYCSWYMYMHMYIGRVNHVTLWSKLVTNNIESNISEQLNPCSIGLALNEDCYMYRYVNYTIFKGTHGLIKATDLSKENKRLLECENIKLFSSFFSRGRCLSSCHVLKFVVLDFILNSIQFKTVFTVLLFYWILSYKYTCSII